MNSIKTKAVINDLITVFITFGLCKLFLSNLISKFILFFVIITTLIGCILLETEKPKGKSHLLEFNYSMGITVIFLIIHALFHNYNTVILLYSSCITVFILFLKQLPYFK